MRPNLVDSVLGKFVRFAWLAMSRSVTTETVSIGGTYFYIQITRKGTSVIWYSFLKAALKNAKTSAITPTAEGIAYP